MNSVGVGRELLERFADRPEADRQLFRVNAFGAAEVNKNFIFIFIFSLFPPSSNQWSVEAAVNWLCFRPAKASDQFLFWLHILQQRHSLSLQPIKNTQSKENIKR